MKARAFLWCGHEASEVGPTIFGGTTDCRLAGTILRDLIAMLPPERHPDAALLDAFRRWVASESRHDIHPEISEEEAASVARDGKRLLMEIAAAPARTAQGMAAKTYAAAHWLHGAPAGAPAVAVNLPELDPEDVASAMQHSPFRDALAQLPEMAAVMGAVAAQSNNAESEDAR